MISGMRDLRLRDAVRAVLLDERDRVLLVRFEFPQWTGWATPGGGVDLEETDEDRGPARTRRGGADWRDSSSGR